MQSAERVWCVGGGCSLALAPASSVARRACLFLPCLRGLAWSLLDGAWTWGRWRAIAVLFAQVGGCNTVLWQEALEEHGFFARETRLPCAPAMPEQAANCSSGTAGDSDRQGGRVHRQQQGVFRVNCVDCLDRTNVAQSVLAFRMALNQLHALSLCTGEDVEACLAAVSSETPLPFAWADALDKKVSSPSTQLPTCCACSICC